MGLKVGSSKIRSLIATDRDARRNVAAKEYKRKTDFIDYTDPSTQKIVGIFGVLKEDKSNYVAFKITCSEGYTVDWGDGTVENFTNGQRANHRYNWDDFDSSTESTIHGKVYRQAKVSITAQSSGQITYFDFQERNDDVVAGRNSSYEVNWLELTINTPYVTTLQDSIGGTNVRLRRLRQVNIIAVAANCVKADNLFYDCNDLKVIEFGFDTSQITDWRSTFLNCFSIELLDHIDFSGTTASDGVAALFQGCANLKRIPDSFYEIDFSNITSLSYTFYYCTSITRIKLFDTSTVTSFSNTFGYCKKLLYIPKFDTSSCTSFYRTFYYCQGLRKIPEIDTSSGTNFRDFAHGCHHIVTCPLLDTSNGTDFRYMFRYCYSLQTVPVFDLTSATNIIYIFSECFTLEFVEFNLNPNYSNKFQALFYYCRSLKEVKGLENIKPSSLQNCFQGCSQLIKLPEIDTRNINTRYGYNYFCYACSHLREIPESIFYGLSNTGNTDWYRAFYGCYSLTEFPTTFFQLSAQTTFISVRELFRNIGVSKVPTLNLSSITSDSNQLNMYRDSDILSEVAVKGCKYNISFYNSFLNVQSLTAVFDGLENASKTIDIQLNPGLADLTDSMRDVATDKGWTITE